jgi:ribose/xylose/arabinose/galactoside ABC-type transport system permease subunit
MSVTATEPDPTTARVSRRGDRARRMLWAPVVVFGVFLVVAAATTSGFLTGDNLKSVLLSSAFVGIIAVGMTPITIGGNLFSLSLGITAAVCAMAFTYFLRLGFVEAIVLALAIGGLACGLQGWLVGALGANPIIVTIAAGLLQGAVATWLSGGTSVLAPKGASFHVLTSSPLGFAFPIYAFIGVTLAVELVLRRTRFGSELYLVGDSKAAARAAALSITRIATGAFTIAGVCAAAAGILLTSTYHTATLNLQGTYSYDAIAAVLVGGNAVAGGRGSAIQSFLGALVIAAATSIALLRGYSTGVQILIKGLIVLGVVVLIHIATAGRSR